MKQFTLISLWVIINLCTSVVKAQTTYYYNGVGDLMQLSSWGSNTDGSGTAPNNFSSSGVYYELRNCDTVILNNSFTISGAGSRLIIGDNNNETTFNIPASFQLNATVIVKNNATLIIENTTIPTLDSMYQGSTVKYLAIGQQTLSSKSYYNLEIGGAGAKKTTGDLIVNNKLIVNDTLDFNTASEDLTGTLNTLSGNGILRTASSGRSPIPSNLAWPFSVEFYRNDNQYVPPGKYRYLHISGNSGIKKAIDGNVEVDSLLNVQEDNTFSLDTNRLLGYIKTATGLGIISTLHTDSFAIPENKTWELEVKYAASAAGQFIASGNYKSLSITSGTNTNKSNGNIHILDNGFFQISSANILEMNSHLLTFGSNITISGAGTLKTQNTSSTPIPANQIWSQSVFYNGNLTQTVVAGTYNAALSLNGGNRNILADNLITVNGNFTASSNAIYSIANAEIKLAGNSNQTITTSSNFKFYHVTFSGSGIKTMASILSVQYTLQIDSGVVLNLATFSLADLPFMAKGSVYGKLKTQNTSTFPIPNSFYWPFAVSYDGAKQYVVNGNYGGGLYCSGNASEKIVIGNVSVGSILSISNTTTLSLNGYNLTLTGVMDNSQIGTFTGSSQSSLIIADTTIDAGTIYFNMNSVESKSLKQLVLNRNTGDDALELGSELFIHDALELLNGTIVTNGGLVFVSTANSDAQLKTIKGSGNIDGLATVQRFIQSKQININSRWCFISPSVNSESFIATNWQKQIYITGAGIGGSACPDLSTNNNGFDVTLSNRPTCYTFNQSTQQWNPLLNTNNTKLYAGNPYRVFIRGNRNQGCDLLTSNINADEVTLEAMGNLITGNYYTSCATHLDDYTMIGNPYQATIDWNSTGIIKSNINASIYGWNNQISNTGAYGVFLQSPIPDSTNGLSRFIAPGGAFFVQTTADGNASVTFTEEAKSSAGNSSLSFKQSTTNSSVLRVQLFSQSANQLNDEAVLRVIPDSKLSYSVHEDVRKPYFENNQIALHIPNDSIQYAILRIPNVFEIPYVDIALSAPEKEQLFYLKIIAAKTFGDSIDVYLYDSYLNKTIDLKADSIYAFSNTDQSLSYRFRLLWKHHLTHLLQAIPNDNHHIELFPNPTDNQLNLILPNGNFKEVIIYNQIGQKLLQFFPLDELKNNFTINTSNLPNDIYYIEFKGSQNHNFQRFIVAHN